MRTVLKEKNQPKSSYRPSSIIIVINSADNVGDDIWKALVGIATIMCRVFSSLWSCNRTRL
jgi:hypothetical protein